MLRVHLRVGESAGYIASVRTLKVDEFAARYDACMLGHKVGRGNGAVRDALRAQLLQVSRRPFLVDRR